MVGKILVAGAVAAVSAFGGDVSSGGETGNRYVPKIDCLAELVDTGTPENQVVRVLVSDGFESSRGTPTGQWAVVVATRGLGELQLETPVAPGEWPSSRLDHQWSPGKKYEDGHIAIGADGKGEIEFRLAPSEPLEKAALKDCRAIDPTTDKIVPIPQPGRVNFSLDAKAEILSDEAKVTSALEALSPVEVQMPYSITFKTLFRYTAMLSVEVGREDTFCEAVKADAFLKQYRISCQRKNPGFARVLQRP
jgi:hypothetical protein